MNPGRLVICDRTFKVTSATLMGYLTTVDDRWCCKWHVDIETEGREFPPTEDGIYPVRWAPYAYAYHIRANVRSWKDFDGIVIVGEDEQGYELSPLRSETAFRLCVYEHLPIKDNRIEFRNRRSDVFDLTWTGTAAIDWRDELPFRVECEVRFTRVALRLFGSIPDAPDPNMAEILAGVLNPADLRQLATEKSITDDGRSEWETDFVPK